VRDFGCNCLNLIENVLFEVPEGLIKKKECHWGYQSIILYISLYVGIQIISQRVNHYAVYGNNEHRHTVSK